MASDITLRCAAGRDFDIDHLPHFLNTGIEWTLPHNFPRPDNLPCGDFAGRHLAASLTSWRVPGVRVVAPKVGTQH